jgi:hypothetical protein
MTAFRGSCRCGEVAFEVEGPFDHFPNCHCSRCRKASGKPTITNRRGAGMHGRSSQALAYLDTKPTVGFASLASPIMPGRRVKTAI